MSDLYSEALGIAFQNYTLRPNLAFKRVVLPFRIQKVPGSDLVLKLAVLCEDFLCFSQSLQ
jgi:hypothetical protein